MAIEASDREVQSVRLEKHTEEWDFVELVGDLFLAGTNMGHKLGVGSARSQVKLMYDRSQRELSVTYGGKTAKLPITSVFSWQPKLPELAPMGWDPEKDPSIKPPTKIKAQVSSPTSHVFGEGPGKTRD